MKERLHKHAKTLGEKFGSQDWFCAGDHFTVVDAYLNVCLSWNVFVGVDMSEFKNLSKYQERFWNIRRLLRLRLNGFLAEEVNYRRIKYSYCSIGLDTWPICYISWRPFAPSAKHSGANYPNPAPLIRLVLLLSVARYPLPVLAVVLHLFSPAASLPIVLYPLPLFPVVLR